MELFVFLPLETKRIQTLISTNRNNYVFIYTVRIHTCQLADVEYTGIAELASQQSAGATPLGNTRFFAGAGNSDAHHKGTGI